MMCSGSMAATARRSSSFATESLSVCPDRNPCLAYPPRACLLRDKALKDRQSWQRNHGWVFGEERVRSEVMRGRLWSSTLWLILKTVETVATLSYPTGRVVRRVSLEQLTEITRRRPCFSSVPDARRRKGRRSWEGWGGGTFVVDVLYRTKAGIVEPLSRIMGRNCEYYGYE